MGPYWQKELTEEMFLKPVIIFSFIMIIRSSRPEVPRSRKKKCSVHLWKSPVIMHFWCLFRVLRWRQEGKGKPLQVQQRCLEDYQDVHSSSHQDLPVLTCPSWEVTLVETVVTQKPFPHTIFKTSMVYKVRIWKIKLCYFF